MEPQLRPSSSFSSRDISRAGFTAPADPLKEILHHAESFRCEGVKKLEGLRDAVGSRLALVQAQVDIMRMEATKAVRHVASEIQRRQLEGNRQQQRRQQLRLGMPAPGFAVSTPPFSPPA